MPSYIHRPRQAVGVIYLLMYTFLFGKYFILRDDLSWAVAPSFTALVILWFILSLGVKVSMLMDRSVELLNLLALLAFMSLGFLYIPHPGDFGSIENFCYYLILTGGSACDFFDFLYESGAKASEDT